MTPFAELLRKWLKFLILISLLAMVITAIIVPRLPRGVDVSTSLTVSVLTRPESKDYEYDGFYALQATDLFSNTLAGWFKSPDFVSAIFHRADLSVPANNLRRLQRVFTIRKVSGQLIDLEFHAKDNREAGKIVEAVANTLQEQINAFNEEGHGPLEFNVIVGKPIFVEVVRNTLVRTLVSGLITFVVGLNLVILVDFLKSKESA